MYFLLIDGQQHGPYTADEVRQWRDQNLAAGEVMVWAEGWSEWRKIGEVEELGDGPPPPAPAETAAAGEAPPGETEDASPQPPDQPKRIIIKKVVRPGFEKPREKPAASPTKPAPAKERTCPNCQSPMDGEAVLCVKCGYNLATRQVVPGMGAETLPKEETAPKEEPAVEEEPSPVTEAAAKDNHEEAPLRKPGGPKSPVEQVGSFMLGCFLMGFIVSICSDGFTSRCGWFYGIVAGLGLAAGGSLVLLGSVCAHRLMARRHPDFTSSHARLLSRIPVAVGFILSAAVTVYAFGLVRWTFKANALGLDGAEPEAAIAWFAAKGPQAAPYLMRIALYNGVQVQKKNSAEVVSIGSFEIRLRDQDPANAVGFIRGQCRRYVWDSEPNPTVARGALDALKRIGTPATPFVCEALKSRSWLEAIPGIDCVKPDPQALVPAVVESLKRTITSGESSGPAGSFKQDFLYEVLARMGPAAGKDAALLLAVDLEKNHEVPRALRVLGAMGPGAKEALSALIPYARNPNQDWRNQALRLLGSVGRDDLTAVPVLLDALADDDPGGVQAAVASLQQCVTALGPSTVPHLLKTLKEYPDVKTAPVAGTSASGEEASRLAANLEKSVRIRKTVLDLFARLAPTSKNTAQVLDQALQGSDLALASEAVGVFERFGGEEARQVLAAYVEKFKDDPARQEVVANARRVSEALSKKAAPK